MLLEDATQLIQHGLPAWISRPGRIRRREQPAREPCEVEVLSVRQLSNAEFTLKKIGQHGRIHLIVSYLLIVGAETVEQCLVSRKECRGAGLAAIPDQHGPAIGSADARELYPGACTIEPVKCLAHDNEIDRV